MLDLSNIQGNILRGYASFPHAHFLYLEIHNAEDARLFLQRLLDTGSVTPGQWHKKPEATLNLAVTFDGLRARRRSRGRAVSARSARATCQPARLAGVRRQDD